MGSPLIGGLGRLIQQNPTCWLGMITCSAGWNAMNSMANSWRASLTKSVSPTISSCPSELRSRSMLSRILRGRSSGWKGKC